MKSKSDVSATGANSQVGSLPERLSPSRVKDYFQCPRLFYFKSVLGISTPPTEATLRGNLAHVAFERIFDRPRSDRGVEHALLYASAALKVELDPFGDHTSEHASAVSAGHGLSGEVTPAERARWEGRSESALGIVGECGKDIFLSRLEKVVEGWYGLETPGRFDPAERELHVIASMFGVTVHGYVDRLDRIQGADGEETVYVSDYKTGKIPSDRFLGEAFFQLEIYALLLARSSGTVVNKLRLLYTASGTQSGVITREVTPALLVGTEKKLRAAWNGMNSAHREGDWKGVKQPLCNWCHFKPVCPEYHPELRGLLPEEVQDRLAG